MVVGGPTGSLRGQNKKLVHTTQLGGPYKTTKSKGGSFITSMQSLQHEYAVLNKRLC